MKRRLLALVLSAMTAAAFAVPLGDNTVRLLPSQLKLPQNIGPLRYSGENRFSDRRLGRSFGFNASGISLSIYVYDYGVTRLPDGPDSVAACEQYESAKAEIERGGNYDNVRLLGEVSRPLADVPGLPVTREAVYAFERRGVHAVSVLWLTAVDGNFFKLRLSLRREVADELDEARPQVLAAFAAAIEQSRKARRRPLPPVPEAPPAEEASIEVDASQDADAAALWLVHARELVRYTREHPRTRPPCGGRLFAGHAAELSALRAALREYRAREGAKRHVRYFDELARIDDAGLLAEYSWHYLRNERWEVTPPPGLDLARFEAFRQRELPAHEPQSGARVRINTVRTLPAP